MTIADWRNYWFGWLDIEMAKPSQIRRETRLLTLASKPWEDQ